MNKTSLEYTLVSDRRKVYEEILRKEKGIKSELEISEEMFEDFCRIGYIQQGMSGEWEETWKLTDFGRKQMTSFVNLVEQGDVLASIEANLKTAIADLEAVIA